VNVRKRKAITVGGLFPMLAILASCAVVFGVIALATGYTAYAEAIGVLFGLLVVFAAGDSLLARHQVRAAAGEGALPVLPIDLRDPFAEHEFPEEVGIHDFPPGHPARSAFTRRARQGR
jgi:hypothetical protein